MLEVNALWADVMVGSSRQAHAGMPLAAPCWSARQQHANQAWSFVSTSMGSQLCLLRCLSSCLVVKRVIMRLATNPTKLQHVVRFALAVKQLYASNHAHLLATPLVVHARLSTNQPPALAAFSNEPAVLRLCSQPQSNPVVHS